MLASFGIEKKVQNHNCKICGDQAQHAYFGVIACQACKMFFKRYAEKKQGIFTCAWDNRCEINVKTRQFCSACRLEKCFQSGMQIELIRHWPRGKSARKPAEKNVVSHSLLPVMNIVHENTSFLTDDQWTLINNMLWVYDLPKLFHVAQNLRTLSPNIDIGIVRALLNTFYEEGGEVCQRNADFRRLLSPERSAFLSTVVNNLISLGGIYVSSQTYLVYHPEFITYMERIYGKLVIQYYRWVTTFVRCDDILFKLALNLFALSTHSRTFHGYSFEEYPDVKSILTIENRYVEIIWKYLLHRYKFKVAMEKYVQLIRWFSAMSVFMYYANSSLVHADDIQSLVEEIQMKLIIDDVDDMF